MKNKGKTQMTTLWNTNNATEKKENLLCLSHCKPSENMFKAKVTYKQVNPACRKHSKSFRAVGI
jgi:hypothetical protein